MSRFFSEKYNKLKPYTPGEQPQDMQYVKLNTNESPFPPSLLAIAESCKQSQKLQLYSDPEVNELVNECARIYNVKADQIIFTNGSDEVLNFAFMCWCDEKHPAAFADITYGFYPVFAEVNNIPYVEIPLNDKLEINVEDYIGINKNIFIANPNAPTGITLEPEDIKRIIESNPDNIIVVDEAYVDFGATSMVPYINDYNNLLVVQTFSKARSMAGARLGMGFGNAELIKDLRTIKYSTNPYNVNRMSMAAGIGALKDEYYTRSNIETIKENREFTINVLRDLGFYYTPSLANFIFVKCPWIGGEELYLKLKDKGVLVRHFSKERIREFIRVTIGKRDQMEKFLDCVIDILEEQMQDEAQKTEIGSTADDTVREDNSVSEPDNGDIEDSGESSFYASSDDYDAATYDENTEGSDESTSYASSDDYDAATYDENTKGSDESTAYASSDDYDAATYDENTEGSGESTVYASSDDYDEVAYDENAEGSGESEAYASSDDYDAAAYDENTEAYGDSLAYGFTVKGIDDSQYNDTGYESERGTLDDYENPSFRELSKENRNAHGDNDVTNDDDDEIDTIVVGLEDMDKIREAILTQAEDEDRLVNVSVDFDPNYDSVEHLGRARDKYRRFVTNADGESQSEFYDEANEEENDLVIVYDQEDENPKKARHHEYINHYDRADAADYTEPGEVTQKIVPDKKKKKARKNNTNGRKRRTQ